jgi:hypothetical protein
VPEPEHRQALGSRAPVEPPGCAESREPPPEGAFSLFSYILTSETDPASSASAPGSMPPGDKAALSDRTLFAAEV